MKGTDVEIVSLMGEFVLMGLIWAVHSVALW